MAFLKTSTGSTYALLFFTPAEASLLDALVARIIPDEDGSPGAKDAGVTEYIDHALAGSLHDLQPVYRDGLRALSAYSEARFGSSFRFIDRHRQEAVVEELDRLATADERAFLGRFFQIVREHTVQGYFGDPAYGGNRDAVSWTLIGFPGAQQAYSSTQLETGFDSARIPVLTVNDLYRRIHEKRQGPEAGEQPVPYSTPERDGDADGGDS